MPKKQSPIKKYTKKNGETAYEFQVYTGINPETGKYSNTKRRGFKTYREASTELKRIEAAVANKTYYTDVEFLDLTFKEVYEKWLNGYQHTVRESTLRTVKSHFKNQILPAFETYKVRQLTTDRIQEKANEWSTHAVVNKYLNYTNLVLDYALRINTLDKNPMLGVIKPKVNNNKKREKTYWSKKELKKFLSEAKKYEVEQAYPLFRLLAFSGLRRGEVLALEWSEVDFKNKTLLIKHTLTRSEEGLYIEDAKTKSSKRQLSLDDLTVKILKEWRKKNMQTSRVFNNENGKILSPSKPRKWLLSICSNIDDLEPIHIHGFRHTHASLLFEAGANIKEVQARLGHSSVKITMDVYTHVTKESRDSFADTFSKYVNF